MAEAKEWMRADKSKRDAEKARQEADRAKQAWIDRLWMIWMWAAGAILLGVLIRWPPALVAGETPAGLPVTLWHLPVGTSVLHERQMTIKKRTATNAPKSPIQSYFLPTSRTFAPHHDIPRGYKTCAQ